MNPIPSSSGPCRALLGIALTVSPALAQVNPNITLRAPHLAALPGQTVTVPVMMDNALGLIQGWSFSCNIASPLVVSSEAAGTTTAALNGGLGPDFLVATSYPGQGFTVGCVISFFGQNPLPVGSDYELHTCTVVVPANAIPGTIYPIRFGTPAIGAPPVATVLVMGGQSFAPTIAAGSILVSLPASVTHVATSDCPVPPMGNLVSWNNPSLGSNWDLQVQGTPAGATHGLYVLGLALQPVPIYMGPFGSPCSLRVTSEYIAFGLTAGSSVQNFSLAIPYVPVFAGLDVYVQGMHDGAPVPPFSGFLGLPVAYYFTNTLRGRVGL